MMRTCSANRWGRPTGSPSATPRVSGMPGRPPRPSRRCVLGAVDRVVVVRVVVALGAAVVGSGSLVVFVGAGSLVFGGAGGAMRGCCPEPKRNPTTVPGDGS